MLSETNLTLRRKAKKNIDSILSFINQIVFLSFDFDSIFIRQNAKNQADYRIFTICSLKMILEDASNQLNDNYEYSKQENKAFS